MKSIQILVGSFLVLGSLATQLQTLSAAVSPSSKISLSTLYSSLSTQAPRARSKTYLVQIKGKAALELYQFIRPTTSSDIECSLIDRSMAASISNVRCCYVIGTQGQITGSTFYTFSMTPPISSLNTLSVPRSLESMIERAEFKTSPLGILSISSPSRGIEVRGSVAMRLAQLLKYRSLRGDLPALTAGEVIEGSQIRCQVTRENAPRCEIRVSETGRAFKRKI